MIRNDPSTAARVSDMYSSDLLLDLEVMFGQAKQALPGIGQLYPFALAVKKQHIMILLEFSHLFGNRGLRQKKRLCRTGEPAMQRHVVECFQLAVAHETVLS